MANSVQNRFISSEICLENNHKIRPAFLTFFLAEVIICSYNNNALQKWTNGKAFNIMASAQFFTT